MHKKYSVGKRLSGKAKKLPEKRGLANPGLAKQVDKARVDRIREMAKKKFGSVGKKK